MKITTNIRNLIANLLVNQKKITNYQLKELKSGFPQTPLEEILLSKGIVSQSELTQLIQKAQTYKLKTEYFPPSEDSSPQQKNEISFIEDLKTKEAKTVAPPTFKSYEILDIIAQGGMGIVYRARHKTLNSIVALKIIIAGEGATEEMIARFHREAKITAKLKHPFIVQVHDSGQEQGFHFFVMEFIEGLTLAEWITTSPSIRDIVELFQKILSGLHYAHEQNILHRDLKPANIFITKNKEPKIGDFGLAREISNTHSHQLTQSGTVMGSPSFMSPEQISGHISQLDPRTDIYSIGVCLYEALTQQLPFQGESIHELFFQIIAEDAPPPSKWNDKIAKDLALIVLKSIEKVKSKRYATAFDFAKDLQRFQEGLSISVRPATSIELFSKWLKRNRYSVGIGVLFSLLMFALFISYHWKQYQQKQYQLNTHLTSAKQQESIAEQISDPSQKKQFEKFEHLFKAFHFLNKAVTLQPKKAQLRIKKGEIGEKLITLACQLEEFALAKYIARDITEMTISPQRNYLKEIKANEIKNKANHLATFQKWIKLIETRTLRKEEKEDAIYFIIKIPPKIILPQLLKYLEESVSYFTKGNQNNSKKECLYQIVVKIIGRLNDPVASKPLLEALKKLTQHTKEIKSKEVSKTLITHMITITQALANLKQPQYAIELMKIRQSIGKPSRFWDNTKHSLKKLIKTQENNGATTPDFYRIQGELHFYAGEYKKALTFFDKLKVVNQKDSIIYNYRGVSQFRLKNYKEASKEFEKALTLTPTDASIYSNLGGVELEQKKFKKALFYFEKACAIDPNDIGSQYNLGVIKNSLGNVQGAMDCFNIIISLNPQFADAYAGKGRTYLKLNQYEEAIKNLTIALDLNPTARDYNKRGHIKGTQGSYDEAILDFNKALEINPQFAEAYNNRGYIKRINEDETGALRDFNEAIRLNPTFSKAYCNRGRMKMRKNKLAAAIRDFDQAVKHAPATDEPYYYRANANMIQYHYKKALPDLQKVLSLNPKRKEAILQRGSCYLFLGKIRPALKDFELYIKKYPDDEKGYLHRGKVYLVRKEYQKAFADYDLVIRRAPNENPDAYLNRGLIYEIQGKFVKALSDFEVASTLNPNYANIYFSQGKVYQRIARFDEAINAFEKGLKIAPNYKAQQMLLGILQKRFNQRIEQRQFKKALSDLLKLQKYFQKSHPYQKEIQRNIIELKRKIKQQK